MTELLHADAIQQLEVALLGSPAAQIPDLLSTGVMQLTLALQKPLIHAPQAYTSTLMAPLPTSVPVVFLTSSSLPLVSLLAK